MLQPSKEEVEDILREYSKKLEQNYNQIELPSTEAFSREYEIFRGEALYGKDSFYESMCNLSERIIKVKPKKNEERGLQKAIEIAHLNITPIGANSFAALVSIFSILLALLASFGPYLVAGVLTGEFSLANLGIFMPLLMIIAGFALIKPISNYPKYLANKTRLQASNQMVLCILYIVIYMRHTSNLEHAIKFSGEHIGMPLALDLRKVFWDVETGRFSSIKESLDNYLETWRDYNLEFVESFHLIESSLYESRNDKRVELLDKSLEVMLEGTYTNMLHFAHNLKSPITTLYMLGIILPILGLVIFPLIASFFEGRVKWWHLAMLYNVLLPVFVLLFGNSLLAKRPTGYGESEISEFKREYKTIKKDAFFIAFVIGFIFLSIGFSPIILHYTNPGLDQAGFLEDSIGGKVLDYKCSSGRCIGPYGFWSLILSLFIPLGIAMSVGIYYRLKTKDLIKIRDETKKLESEFASSLFQLGNVAGSGLPIEVAIEKTAINMRGTPAGSFFSYVSDNLRKAGMNLNEAIFDKKRGAILFFPSGLIESTMKILVESSRKGSSIVAKTLTSISDYVTRVNRVNERLKDLLAEIVSSMKSQTSFLTPMIAGIIVGVSSMVVTLVNELGKRYAQFGTESVEGLGNVADLLGILNIEKVIPSFHFQVVVGLFVIEIIVILTILSNSIENGVDKLGEKNSLAKNLFFGVVLYSLISLIGIIIFNILAKGIGKVS